MSTTEPEIIHSADIPEDAAAVEAQDAIMARVEALRPGPGTRSKRERKQAKGAEKLQEKIAAARALAPLVVQPPRKVGNPAMVKGGKSVNPGGITKIDRQIRDYARAHCFEAIDFCVAVMRDPLCRTSDRLAAAAELIDNARLPKAAGDDGGQGGNTITINVLKIGDQVIKF